MENNRLKDIIGALRSRVKITSFDTVTLRRSGMRGATEDEIVMKDGMAEVSEYMIRFSQGKDERVLEKRVLCSGERVLAILNRCRMLSWDGFYGKHPRRIMDGMAFNLKAAVNGGKKIEARGSQNFPGRFREFTDWLYEILNGPESVAEPVGTERNTEE